VSVGEPVTDPAYGGDDTILIVYRDAFDPANACTNFVGIGNETAGAGLTVSLASADGYILVVGGFFGTQDDYTVTITGQVGSAVSSGAAASATLTGTDGWRMLAAPSTSETIAGLLDPLWTQGFPDAGVTFGTPNVYRYVESVTTDTDGSGDADLNDGYEAPGSATDAVPAGTGLFVYAFADDPSTPEKEDFPKVLMASGTPPPIPFSFPISYTSSGDANDDGWNLLGNPFETGLDWNANRWVKTNLSDAIYVYDTPNNRYLTYSTSAGGSLGPVVGAYQGFWVKATGAGPVLTAPEASRFTGGTFYGRRAAAAPPPAVVLRVRGEVGGVTREDEARVAFVAGSIDALDPADAYELAGFGPDALRLFAVAPSETGLVGLDISAVPAGGALVALGVEAEVGRMPVAGTFALTWPELSLPDGWTARLTDRQTGAEIDLRVQSSYSFSTEGSAQPLGASLPDEPVLRPAAPRPIRLAETSARLPGTYGRFELRVSPAQPVGNTEEAASDLYLSPPRPNPTSRTTTFLLSLPRTETVQAEVYDALGRKIATVVENTLAAGRHELRVDTANWTPGTYVLRVTTSLSVESHAFSVVR